MDPGWTPCLRAGAAVFSGWLPLLQPEVAWIQAAALEPARLIINSQVAHIYHLHDPKAARESGDREAVLTKK